MTRIVIILVLIAGAICSGFNAYAQEQKAWSDMNIMEQSQPWLQSSNAIGLQYAAIDTISEAGINLVHANGDFINYNESNKSNKLDIYTRSYFKLNQMIWLYGDVMYSNFAGKNMGASSFIDPENAPFNIVEYTEDTKGKKKAETYQLKGAVAAKISQRFSIGGSFAYTAMNYTKMKDLRHANKMLDMELSIGTSFLLHPNINIGLNYIYNKRVEEIQYQLFGNTDQIYNSLIAWGGFWGQVETFGRDGFTGSDENNPLTDNHHGIALQVDWKLSKNISFFNEATYTTRKGMFGVDSYNNIIFAEHTGNEFAYHATIKKSGLENDHLFKIKYNTNKLENEKTNYNTNYNPETGVTSVSYNTPTKVLDRTLSKASIEYLALIDNKEFAPKWELAAKVDLYNRNQTASIYPYYRKQNITSINSLLSAKRTVYKSSHSYSLGLAIGYHTGFGDPFEDGQYASSSGNSVIRNADFYTLHEHEYLTADMLNTKLTLGYGRLFNNYRLFSQFTINNNLAISDLSSINERYHLLFNLSIGCVF